MKHRPIIFLVFAVMLVIGATASVPQSAPPICAVVFDRRGGEFDVLYGISCPVVFDSVTVSQLKHSSGIIPPWCDVFGVFLAPNEPLVRAQCSRPPTPQGRS